MMWRVAAGPGSENWFELFVAREPFDLPVNPSVGLWTQRTNSIPTENSLGDPALYMQQIRSHSEKSSTLCIETQDCDESHPNKLRIM